MTEYNAIGEIEIAPTTKRIVKWLDALEGYSAAVSRTDRGRTEIVITVDAPALEAAAATALAVLRQAAGQLSAFQIMTTAEYDRRTDETAEPEYLGATEAADLLGTTRQYVQQLAASKTLPSIRIGERTLAFPKAAVEAFAAQR
jgi:excisionase family DNA binding protein